MTQDRADVIATGIIARVAQRLRDDPELRADLVALLRDELADHRREILADLYGSPEE